MAAFLSLLRRLYLTAYNWILFAGWFQVLFLTLKTLKESGHAHVYSNIQKPLLVAQTAALLELYMAKLLCLVLKSGRRSILHCIVGLVRSPISTTVPQISSRLYMVWGILYSFPEVQTHPLISSLVISCWCIAEIVRYAFYGTKEAFGSAPYLLLWLRYSTFFVLYPTGIASEIGMIYNALPFMKESGLYSVRMPNKWNFSFNHMLRQRKKTLTKPKEEYSVA
ncbi:putative very-long-chain (3R)-3-hydroxyacyl-CoA dehydratase [Helianthus debilis subsp. tardiflorus]